MKTLAILMLAVMSIGCASDEFNPVEPDPIMGSIERRANFLIGSWGMGNYKAIEFTQTDMVWYLTTSESTIVPWVFYYTDFRNGNGQFWLDESTKKGDFTYSFSNHNKVTLVFSTTFVFRGDTYQNHFTITLDRMKDKCK